jgi:hypothetical protein
MFRDNKMRYLNISTIIKDRIPTERDWRIKHRINSMEGQPKWFESEKPTYKKFGTFYRERKTTPPPRAMSPLQRFVFNGLQKVVRVRSKEFTSDRPVSS